MKQTRHPHPHIDPRAPRHGAQPGTNPPVFVWKPPEGERRSTLVVARDPAFSNVCLREEDLAESVYLPEAAFQPGRYFWKWSCSAGESEVFRFDILPDAVVLEVPPATEWLKRFPAEHPRTFIRPEDVSVLRESRGKERAELWNNLRAEADELLAKPHELAEPPFLPGRDEDYEKEFGIWRRILFESREFVGGAATLAFAYLASGDARYGRAACRRMASVSRWDPEGSSHISHNDEAHMSIIWWGSQACDWAWDQFTDDERERVVDQFRRRAEITYNFMHSRGCYGVTRFDSHAGREIVFLALIALVFHEHIPDAVKWLDWLRPVLCGIWPSWAGDDGGWAQGLSYGLAYVSIMTMFATALKRGADVDLYRRPFWRNHARWRAVCMPPYAEWIGFGDHSERWAGTWYRSAHLVELIDRETGANELGRYVAQLREEAAGCAPRFGGDARAPISYQSYLARPVEPTNGPAPRRPALTVFPAVGWAAIRTDLADASRDIALIFRSSPLGAVSHSHANNNDFIIHVAGKVMAMPSGYYAGYGSDHHAHWVWHTKSHNCVTLSDASQLMRSHDSAGAIENTFEDERLVYFRGNADPSYSDRAERCRRHVVFLKAHACFVMIDEFVARPDVRSCLQWNIHSWAKFTVDSDKRTFLLENDASSLRGHFMYHHNAFFSLTDGWDPPPMAKEGKERRNQYHLRFTLSGIEARARNLGVVLCAGHASLEPATVHAERSGATEIAHIGDDLVLINQEEGIEHGELRSDALAVLVVQGRRYDITDAGLVTY